MIPGKLPDFFCLCRAVWQLVTVQYSFVEIFNACLLIHEDYVNR